MQAAICKLQLKKNADEEIHQRFFCWLIDNVIFCYTEFKEQSQRFTEKRNVLQVKIKKTPWFSVSSLVFSLCNRKKNADEENHQRFFLQIKNSPHSQFSIRNYPLFYY